MSLEGKVALVTGAGRGIGRAIALRLARDGADVALCDIDETTAADTAREIAALGRRSLSRRTDVSRRPEVEALVRESVAQLGPVDILVNNAGIVQAKHFMEVTEEDWDRIIAVNVKGVFFCAQAVAGEMIKRGQGGKIINIASIGGKIGQHLLVPYGASKAAVISITQGLSRGLARHGITVNAICPGVVDTAMQDLINQQIGEFANRTPEQVFRSSTRGIPLGRPERPEDVANVVAFLASSDADYMTGQSINVDGGLEFH